MLRRTSTFRAIVLLALAAACDRLPGRAAEADPLEETLAEVEPALLADLPPGVTAEMVAEGRRLYVACSVCHGLEAEGTQLGPPLRGPEWIHITGRLDEIAEIVRTGVARPERYPIPMPVRGGTDLDDADVQAVAAYLHLLARQRGR